MIERKIGEQFKDKGAILEVKRCFSGNCPEDCHYYNYSDSCQKNMHITGSCSCKFRADKTSVYFKKVAK